MELLRYGYDDTIQQCIYNGKLMNERRTYTSDDWLFCDEVDWLTKADWLTDCQHILPNHDICCIVNACDDSDQTRIINIIQKGGIYMTKWMYAICCIDEQTNKDFCTFTITHAIHIAWMANRLDCITWMLNKRTYQDRVNIIY
jgi:hypothetical protein